MLFVEKEIKIRGCTLLYTNIDTITNKMHELQVKITETKAKIIAVVEIHPKNSRYQLTASELNIKNFQLFFEPDSEGRGVCIYVHDSLNAYSSTNTHLPQSLSVTDTMFVEISDTKTKSLVVGVIYRSPNSSLIYSQNLNEMIENLHCVTKIAYYLVIGITLRSIGS